MHGLLELFDGPSKPDSLLGDGAHVMDSPVSQRVDSRSASASTSPTLLPRISPDSGAKWRSRSHHRKNSLGAESRASHDSWKTSRTRASSLSSKSSQATVQDLMAYAEQNPYEFEQSIILLRLTDAVKAQAADRALSLAHGSHAHSSRGRAECFDFNSPSRQPSRTRSKTGRAAATKFDAKSLPRGRNCIVSI